VLRGTTVDDPKILAREFCEKWNLDKTYYRAIKSAIFDK
jgi:hypothetical protein